MPPEVATAPHPAVRKETFLGVSFACLDPHRAAQEIAARPPGSPFVYIITDNASHLVRMNELKDEAFIDICRDAWFHTLDGAVPRRLARTVFGLDIPLCAGSDLTVELFNHFVRPDDAITIIGGSEKLRSWLMETYKLKTVSMHVPPMGFVHDEKEIEACVDFVVDHPARYNFFVVGSPQSEYVMHRVLERGAAVGTGMCVGGSLNFLAGLTQRASPAFRALGLEWLYRLFQSPKTHMRRVFVDSLPIFLTVAKARLRPSAYGMDGGSRPAP